MKTSEEIVSTKTDKIQSLLVTLNLTDNTFKNEDRNALMSVLDRIKGWLPIKYTDSINTKNILNL